VVQCVFAARSATFVTDVTRAHMAYRAPIRIARVGFGLERVNGDAVNLEPPAQIASTLAEGRQAYVVIDAASGPHVTPELYTWHGGALWFAAASTTVKHRVLAEGVSAGALVTAGGRSVVVTGPVQRFDLRHPLDLARRPRDAVAALGGLATYTVRNAPDLLGFLTDTARLRLGLRIPARVLYRLRPDRIAAIEAGAITHRLGEWPGSGQRARGDDPTALGGEPAVVAFDGPVATPGRWFDDDATVAVPPGVPALLGLRDSFDVAVVTDEYGAPGPAAKQGLMRRGRARRVRGRPGVFEVELDRQVTWDGVATESERLEAQPLG
jgi:hypothetical protein